MIDDRAYTNDEIIYSATARCPCGSGLAYVRDCGAFSSWYCAAALRHDLPNPDPFDGKHHEYPFVEWKILSEEQPSAQGATTRPREPKP